MWAGSELRGERGATGAQRVRAPLASADAGRGFRQKCRRSGGLLRNAPPSVAGHTRRPASDRRTGLDSPDKNASSVVGREQDGVKDSSTDLLGVVHSWVAAPCALSPQLFPVFRSRERSCLFNEPPASVRARLCPGVAPDYILQPWCDSWKKQTII